MAKAALITGASSGIGAELARIHAATGGDLVLVARRQTALKALAQELKAAHKIKVHVLAEDLSDEAAPQRIYDAVTAANIDVEYLMNNAGFGGRGKFSDRNWEDDRAMMQVNMVALTALTRLFLPAMIARGHGRILHTSSTAALLPGPLQAVYYASKAYVTSFSNALAEELHDTAITVTALMPGATETGFASRSGMDATALFENTTSAAVVARAGYDAMMRGDLDVITALPASQRLAMRIAPLLPKKALLKSIRKMQEVSE